MRRSGGARRELLAFPPPPPEFLPRPPNEPPDLLGPEDSLLSRRSGDLKNEILKQFYYLRSNGEQEWTRFEENTI